MWISNILDTIWIELGNYMWISLGRPWSRKEFDVVKELTKKMNMHFKIVVASGEQGSRIEFNWGKNGTSRVTVMF